MACNRWLQIFFNHVLPLRFFSLTKYFLIAGVIVILCVQKNRSEIGTNVFEKIATKENGREESELEWSVIPKKISFRSQQVKYELDKRKYDELRDTAYRQSALL